jgi:alanyl-tRNA synthetase
MQFQEDGKGGRTKLPKPSVDTGLGLERTATILQGQLSNYDTDIFQDLIQVASRISGLPYVNARTAKSARQEQLNVALRVVADHARASAFLIADGVLPSNEGRGYVLRRIMRRGIRYARQLSEQDSILPAVVQTVIQQMGGFYADLETQRTLIERTVQDEERRFLATLDQGTHILTQELEKVASGGTLSGEVLFKLYDTFGFPLDLTRVMAGEQGFKVDEAGFEQRLEQAKEVARSSWKGKAMTSDQAFLVQWSQKLNKEFGETEFTGYATTEEPAVNVLAMSDGKSEVRELKTDQIGLVVVNKTCFYAEGGGQVGDRGVLRTSGGEAEVLDCSKQNGVFLHHVKVTDGLLHSNDVAQLVVQSQSRRSTANNHSATHLLHAALRQVLGEHVQQAGSLVESDRLRFDFTHNQPVSPQQIEQLESLVQAEIAKGVQVQSDTMSHQAAIEKGAMALFGEKYGDEVRVVQMGKFSMELCGGIHVSNTSQIRFFKIVSESGVSAGVRRIEAITGERAAEYLSHLANEALAARHKAGLTLNWQKYLEGQPEGLPTWIEATQGEIRALQREVQMLKGKNIDIEQLLSSAQSFAQDGISGRLVFADLGIDDRKVLSDLADRLQDRLRDGVVIIVGQGESSHPLIVSVSKSLAGRFNAGKILGEVAQTLGGKGGGRADFAQGAVPSREGLAAAREKVTALLVRPSN